ncbi:MAG: hypothetical protein PVH19_09445, partial [Planctomycetia bacterium]
MKRYRFLFCTVLALSFAIIASISVVAQEPAPPKAKAKVVLTLKKDGDSQTLRAESTFAVPEKPAPAPAIEPLKKVTLESEEGYRVGIVPLFSSGVEAVNTLGKGAKGEEAVAPKRLTIEYLPGAVLLGKIEFPKSDKEEQDNEFFLPLEASDDGKVLRVRMEGACVYVNDACVVVGFREVKDIEKWLKTHGEKVKKTLRFAVVDANDRCLPVLKWLKGTGVGIGIGGMQDEDDKEASKKDKKAV